jgi:hypothetical protein
LPDQLLTMALPSSTADGPAREWRALERHRRQPALTSGRMVCGTGALASPGGAQSRATPTGPPDGVSLGRLEEPRGEPRSAATRGAMATRCSRSGDKRVVSDAVSDAEASHGVCRRSVVADQGRARNPGWRRVEPLSGPHGRCRFGLGPWVVEPVRLGTP